MTELTPAAQPVYDMLLTAINSISDAAARKSAKSRAKHVANWYGEQRPGTAPSAVDRDSYLAYRANAGVGQRSAANEWGVVVLYTRGGRNTRSTVKSRTQSTAPAARSKVAEVARQARTATPVPLRLVADNTDDTPAGTFSTIDDLLGDAPLSTANAPTGDNAWPPHMGGYGHSPARELRDRWYRLMTEVGYLLELGANKSTSGKIYQQGNDQRYAVVIAANAAQTLFKVGETPDMLPLALALTAWARVRMRGHDHMRVMGLADAMVRLQNTGNVDDWAPRGSTWPIAMGDRLRTAYQAALAAGKSREVANAEWSAFDTKMRADAYRAYDTAYVASGRFSVAYAAWLASLESGATPSITDGAEWGRVPLSAALLARLIDLEPSQRNNCVVATVWSGIGENGQLYDYKLSEARVAIAKWHAQMHGDVASATARGLFMGGLIPRMAFFEDITNRIGVSWGVVDYHRLLWACREHCGVTIIDSATPLAAGGTVHDVITRIDNAVEFIGTMSDAEYTRTLEPAALAHFERVRTQFAAIWETEK